MGVGLLFLFLTLIVSSSAIFFCERGQFDYETRTWIRCVDGICSPGPFQSVFHSIWWCITTVTTVGYGDAVCCESAVYVILL